MIKYLFVREKRKMMKKLKDYESEKFEDTTENNINSDIDCDTNCDANSDTNSDTGSDTDSDIDSAEMEEAGKKARKLGAIQFGLVIMLFVAVICVTEFVSMYAGKMAGNVCMVILAIIIAAWLYKDEIKAKFQRKSSDEE